MHGHHPTPQIEDRLVPHLTPIDSQRLRASWHAVASSFLNSLTHYLAQPSRRDGDIQIAVLLYFKDFVWYHAVVDGRV
jgi:hypothetical protein